jgi:hypothetical protein
MKKALLLLVFGLMITVCNAQEPVANSVDTDVGFTIEQNHSPAIAIATFKTVDLGDGKPNMFYKAKPYVAKEGNVESVKVVKTIYKTPNLLYISNIPIVHYRTYNQELYQNTTAKTIYVTKTEPIIGFSNPVRKIAQSLYYPEHY